MQALWNQTLTKYSFCKSFILKVMHVIGRWTPLPSILRRGFGTTGSLMSSRAELLGGRIATTKGQTIAGLAGPPACAFFFTKNLKLTTDNYLSSRISLSLAADKSSIFLVSAW